MAVDTAGARARSSHRVGVTAWVVAGGFMLLPGAGLGAVSSNTVTTTATIEAFAQDGEAAARTSIGCAGPASRSS